MRSDAMPLSSDVPVGIFGLRHADYDTTQEFPARLYPVASECNAFSDALARSIRTMQAEWMQALYPVISGQDGQGSARRSRRQGDRRH